METTALTTVDQAFAELGEMLEADAKHAEKQYEEAGVDWLPNWFLGKKAELDAARERIKEQAAVMLRQIDGVEKALWWHYGVDFMSQVSRDINAQDGKKRSMDYHHGRAGYRKVSSKPTVVIDDSEKAVAYAMVSLADDAVKQTVSTKAVLDHFKATGEELPGTHIEQTEEKDSFFPKNPAGMLTAEETSDGDD